jgi:putative spermidine/putrescine transport system permease protein
MTAISPHSTVPDTPARRRARPRILRSAADIGLLAPALILLVPLFLLPSALMVYLSFTSPTGLSHYAEAISSGTARTVILRSLVISLEVTAISAVLAVPYAYISVRGRRRIRSLLLAAVGCTLFFSVIVRAYAWLALFSQGGPVPKALNALHLGGADLNLAHTRVAVIIAMVQYGVPYMVLSIYDTYRRVDARVEQAAAICGAGPAARWRTITLPQMLPGIAAGSVIVFVTSLGYYIIPAAVGSPTDSMIGQLISQQISLTDNWGLGSALACVLMLVSVLAFLLFRRVGGRGSGPV